ncbi:hypothetical protein BDQ17DRAFT_1426556 [Cyathus striatus]|nr:hypothetical protein BDQ17DRAFT_1426556 [Cyathus striatus]
MTANILSKGLKRLGRAMLFGRRNTAKATVKPAPVLTAYIDISCEEEFDRIITNGQKLIEDTNDYLREHGASIAYEIREHLFKKLVQHAAECARLTDQKLYHRTYVNVYIGETYEDVRNAVRRLHEDCTNTMLLSRFATTAAAMFPENQESTATSSCNNDDRGRNQNIDCFAHNKGNIYVLGNVSNIGEDQLNNYPKNDLSEIDPEEAFQKLKEMFPTIYPLYVKSMSNIGGHTSNGPSQSMKEGSQSSSLYTAVTVFCQCRREGDHRLTQTNTPGPGLRCRSHDNLNYFHDQDSEIFEMDLDDTATLP